MLSARFRFSFLLCASLIFLCASLAAYGATKGKQSSQTDKTFSQLSSALPDNLGDFHARGAAQPVFETQAHTPQVVGATRLYANSQDETLGVEISRRTTPNEAFAFLMRQAQDERHSANPNLTVEFGEIGIADFVTQSRVVFCQGSTFVDVSIKKASVESAKNLAQLLAPRINSENAAAPVLFAHLPDAETMQGKADYADNIGQLKSAVNGNNPALDALSFEGGTEAVTALYPQGQLVIAEHSSPQFAADAEEAINARISELRAANQPVPSAFRRIGNYSVFVFDAPNEQAANQLLEQVKYEKDVRWLGTNPHAYERAARAYTEMTAQLIITVLKTTGVSILICLTIGGIFGGWVFMRRRARIGAVAAYSDAGGIVRLNLDELTPETDPSRLLSTGDESASKAA
jgi:hypothetical protein